MTILQASIILKILVFAYDSMREVGMPKYAAPRGFSRDDKANLLILSNAYAFILGLIFDQSIKSDIAWASPQNLKQRLGHLNIRRIADMKVNQLASVIAKKRSLHRFPKNTAKHIIKSSKIIRDEFESKADLIWHENKSIISAKKNFLKLCGIGEKKLI